jgi:hypothetical protein
MKIMPPVEQEIRRAIRDERAKDPLITILGLQEKLEVQFNRTFKRDYLARLSDKVGRQTLIELDRTKIEDRMAFTRENYRMMREELLNVVYWTLDDHEVGMPKPLVRDRVEAAKTVVMLDLALLKAEIETGIYKKPIEVLAKEIRYDPLPDDVRTVIIAAWSRGGLLPAATIERMVPNRGGDVAQVHT